ncbi:restriction endonuclease [Streptomyces sp. NPDC048718]|uniref:restriction endonuclease n=1 Tax=Streptomyces sp. NPDC048718 TaxID=3365587 RepID=UPI0037247155
MSGRSPARHRSRRPARRGRSGSDRTLALGVAAVAGFALVTAVVRWMLVHWWVPVGLVVLAVPAGWAWFERQRRKAEREAERARALRYALSHLDALHHSRFEDAVRDLMYRDGCRDAVRVGGGGDLGADVKATDPFGRRWVIQCKHRRKGLEGAAVGTPDFQVLNGTARPVHGADVAVLVTNGRVTAPAATFARQQLLYVVDRHTLGAWASGGRPLWEVLRMVPPPRRPSTLS